MSSPRPVGGRRTLLTVALAFLLALSGCSFVTGGNPLPSGEEAGAKYASLDGYRATYEVTYDRPNGTRHLTANIRASPDTGQVRVNVVDEQRDIRVTLVSNGTVTWVYNRTANRVTRIERSSGPLSQYRTEIRGLVARASGEKGPATPSVRVSPLPVVPGGGPGAGTNGTNRLEVSYGGTATVAGRETYVIQMTPVNETDRGILNRTIWLDSEWFVSLKSRTVVGTPDGKLVFAQTHTDVSFEPGLSNETFAFDPPSNATLVTNDVKRTSYESPAALASATDLPVPRPEVPERFSFKRGYLTVSENGTQATLQYTSGVNSLAVVVGNDSEYDPEGEQIRIGNRTGYFQQSGFSVLVTWKCGGYEYGVVGAVSKETLVDVAESIECG